MAKRMTPEELAAFRAYIKEGHRAPAAASGFNVNTAHPDFAWEAIPPGFSWAVRKMQRNAKQTSQITPKGWKSFGNTTGFVPNVRALGPPPVGTVGTLTLREGGLWGRFPGLLFAGTDTEGGGGSAGGGRTVWKFDQITNDPRVPITHTYPVDEKGVTWDFFISEEQPYISAAAAELSGPAALAKLEPGTPLHHPPSRPNVPALNLLASTAAALPSIEEGNEGGENNNTSGATGEEGGLWKSRRRASRRGLRSRRSLRRSRSRRSRRR
jgi:hypothetical protein